MSPVIPFYYSRCSSSRAHYSQVIMATFKLSQSHSGGVTINPYTDNIAQELQFPTEKTGKTRGFKSLNWVAFLNIRLLEAWLELTSVKYHDNLLILMLLNQWLALTMLRTTGPRRTLDFRIHLSNLIKKGLHGSAFSL